MEENAATLVDRIEEEKAKLDDHITKATSTSLMSRDTDAKEALKELKS